MTASAYQMHMEHWEVELAGGTPERQLNALEQINILEQYYWQEGFYLRKAIK